MCQSLFFKYFTFSRSRRIYERELNFLSAVSHFSLGKRVCCVRSPYTSISIQHRAYASISMLCVPFRKEKKILFGFNYSNYNIYLAMWSARRIHITHTHTQSIQSHHTQMASCFARTFYGVISYFFFFTFILRSHLIDENNCSRLAHRVLGASVCYEY